MLNSDTFRILVSQPVHLSIFEIDLLYPCFFCLEYISLNCTPDIVHGVSETVAGGNSTASSPGLVMLSYPPTEVPYKGCDNDLNTKSLNFGSCNQIGERPLDCGLRTGFYITPIQSDSLATGFRLCTAGDFPNRDPMNITLEGSNENGTDLALGSSWTLIYQGASGLAANPGRFKCGNRVFFSNTQTFSSYRLLITAKRGTDNSIQFSELILIGT